MKTKSTTTYHKAILTPASISLKVKCPFSFTRSKSKYNLVSGYNWSKEQNWRSYSKITKIMRFI